MAEGAGDGSGGATGVKPGALTALLQEVAAAPEQREAETAPLPPGTVIGRFEIIRELGRGGFGVVYEAKDRDLGRQVAVKVVRPGRITEEEGKVSREAESIARLAHPNLITLHEVGRSEHGPFLVFELLRGKTLQERMDDGPMPVQEAVHVATEVARGLAHAHAEGVIHRDLKPANVFATNKGQVKILDFGMAHAFGRRRLSGGTPAYMAPEQWEDDPEDERTDVFALGAMLYRMLTGEYPFPEGKGKWSAEPATVRKLDVPGAPELAELVEKMLDRTPKGRPRDGAAVLAALTPIEDRLRSKPADGAPPEHAKRRKATYGDLLAELKRRHVFRVMLGYGVFVFAVLQVTEPIMHGAHLPDWVLTAVLVVLALGFPVAVILAWVYDLTAQGVKRTPSATGATLSGRARLLLPLAVSVVVLALAAAGGGAWFAWKRVGERPGGGAMNPAAGRPERTAVAVADVVNETGDQELDGLSGLLVTSLQESPSLRVLTRGRIYDAMRQGGKGDTAHIDEGVAREVGVRLGANALLLTSVRRIGDTYSVELRAIEPSSDEYLFAAREQGSGKGQVVVMVDRLASRVRSALLQGREADRVVRPVSDLATSNLDAYRHYTAGMSLIERALPGAEAEFRVAIQLQPDFALAYYALLQSMGEEFWAPAAEIQAVASEALRVAERAPWREGLLIRAWADARAGRAESAATIYRQVLQRDPDDKEALARLGFQEQNPIEAERLCRRALEIDVRHVGGRQCLLAALLAQGRRDEILALGRRWASTPEERAPWIPVYALYIGGAAEEAIRAARKAAEADPGPNGQYTLEFALEAGGAYREMESVARRRLRVTGKGFVQVARALVHQGRRREALKILDAAWAGRHGYGYAPAYGAFLFASGDGPSPALRARARELLALDPGLEDLVASTLAVAGDAEGASTIASSLGAGSPGRVLADARLALASGEPGRARSLVEALAGRQDADDRSAEVLLGEVCLALGDADCAIAAFRRYLAPRTSLRGVPYDVRPWAVARSAVHLAQIHERRGEVQAARELVDRVMENWKDADPDLPMLAEAKAMRVRLMALPK